jgi:5,6-dimethylbenzimidazole synthase
MTLVVGVGLRPGTSYDELRELVAGVLDGFEAAEISVVATLDRKTAEPAVQELARELGAQVSGFAADVLAAQPVPASGRVAEATGTGSVAEAAVLAAGATIVVPKRTSPGATAALGRVAADPGDGAAGASPARDRGNSWSPGGSESPQHQRSAEPYSVAEREVVRRVIADRRDVRRGFLPTPVPDDVLRRVLESAHRAPSVGLSQPWDFLLIRDLPTRRKVRDLAAAQRQAFADALPPDRRTGFDGLKVEAILDSPLNVVVTCDPDRGGRHVLGRHADPRTAAFSAAIAVQNLWLAARAEGVGVGWVSFFEPEQVAAVLGLPAHVEVIAYLCVGYVDAFGAAPELVRSGWADRRPLSWAVHQEEWGRRALPGGGPVSIVDDARGAAELPARVRTQSVRVLVTDSPREPSEPHELVVVVAGTRPAVSRVFWRSANTRAEATEYGVELLRDLALQGIGEIDVRTDGVSPLVHALAGGLRLAADQTGVRRPDAAPGE